jgi:hypothetical protein
MVFAAFRFTASSVEEMAMIGVLDVSLVISVTTGGPHATMSRHLSRTRSAANSEIRSGGPAE